MDPRSKDSIRNTEELVTKLVGLVEDLTSQVEKFRKELKSIKRSTVRKYNKKNG